MNIDKTIELLEQGFVNPDTVIKKVSIPDEQMPQYALRRKAKGATHHLVWMISLGEQNQAPAAWFLDHKIKGALVKALSWRGIQPKPKAAKNGAPAQQAAG
jgi:hypothetical protein